VYFGVAFHPFWVYLFTVLIVQDVLNHVLASEAPNPHVPVLQTL